MRPTLLKPGSILAPSLLHRGHLEILEKILSEALPCLIWISLCLRACLYIRKGGISNFASRRFALNIQNLDAPGVGSGNSVRVGNASAGSITTLAVQPRQLQFGLRFAF